ncbi:helix-turn-helix transcriptional regulator [Lentibacillus jeotgali]|uniref:helix-turn-helix transcriptional regulator n=1 Tax=Lentibacillus jeotgali TaxID=558169 RepID=UPI000262886B|nr:helix-turn-helix transcriptional regulator [Lentibacillus jeotgali]
MRDWLLSIRKQRELTQAEVAKKAGIARTTYSMIETGERGATVKNAKKISSILGFDWTVFFEKNYKGCNENYSKEVI